jgi:hypothetical protein
MHQFLNQLFVFRLLLLRFSRLLFCDGPILGVLSHPVTQQLGKILVSCLQIWGSRLIAIRTWIGISSISRVVLQILEQLKILCVHLGVHIGVGQNVLNVQFVIELVQLLRIERVVALATQLGHLVLLLKKQQLLKLLRTQVPKVVLLKIVRCIILLHPLVLLRHYIQKLFE